VEGLRAKEMEDGVLFVKFGEIHSDAYQRSPQDRLLEAWEFFERERVYARDRVTAIEMVMTQRKVANDGKMPKSAQFKVESLPQREYTTPPNRYRVTRK